MDQERSLAAYDYVLPEGRIAQNPAEPRDSARLMVVNQAGCAHHVFRDLPDLLQPGDLLVLNNTQVIPARLYGHKTSGLQVEVLLLEELDSNRWLTLVKPGRRLKPGARIVFTGHTAGLASTEVGPEPDLAVTATVIATDPATSGRILQFELPEDKPLGEVLNHLGQVPLPPYITETEAEPERYQTIYAARPGAVAAPTAGLHFTSDLFDRLQQKGIQHTFLTLHVGVGTFRPVEAEDITAHRMHNEWVEISEVVVEQIHQTRAQGGRVIAVGTTVVRSLESAAQQGELGPFQGKTDLFIYPGYRWRVVEGLITNFHLPRSSLMMLVSALIGRQRLLDLYQVAIEADYRFYSFGDAMLILPEARTGPS